MKRAGLICGCGSHEVYYNGNTDGLFYCHRCGSFGFRGAFESESEEECEAYDNQKKVAQATPLT